ncbi:TetR/AcrR family transcriptional regulator [Actinomadura yumaensis]|uniref:TetR/AcrR family transcriptional regulator n=1 Tax=Actinomadura yumaensis TaxID=111807 RepID=UPI0036222946
MFAQDGYARASIDAIAARAGVSTRTIYNHFADKAGLFEAVIHSSATRAADAQIAIVDRHLRKVVDLEADLVDFGRSGRRARRPSTPSTSPSPGRSTPRPGTSRAPPSRPGRRTGRCGCAGPWPNA